MPDLKDRSLDGHPAARPLLRCRRAAAGDAVHVALSGELDIAGIAQVDSALRRAWATTDTIILDLRELDFIDSSGTHLILEADRRIRHSGGRLIVVRGPASIDFLFELLGVDRQLELVDEPPALAAAA